MALTEDAIQPLKAAKSNSGRGAAAFLRWAENAPSGLNSMTINHWLAGRVDQANGEYLSFVLEQWPKMPGKTEITDELVGQLWAEEARTGLGPTRIVATMDEVPRGSSAAKISQWKTGRVRTAKKEHVDAVFDAYAKIESGR